MLNKLSRPVRILRAVLCVLFCIFAIVPIYAAVIVALTPYSNMLEPQLVPHYFEISNFALGADFILDNMANSVLYACLTTVVTILFAIPVAYVLARYNFPMRKATTFLLLLTQMMAGIVVLPTLYKMFNSMGLLNNTAVLVLVYSAFNLALVTTILNGYFSSLPKGLDEAAAIDGCGFLQTITRIIIPISGPGIAVAAIFVFVNTYNDFIIPLFLLSDSTKYPLTLSIYSLLSDTTIRWHVMAASSIIGILPPALIFVFFQKYVIQGVTTGAVKG